MDNQYLNKFREAAEKYKTPETIWKMYTATTQIMELSQIIYPEKKDQIEEEKKQVEALMNEYRKVYDFKKVVPTITSDSLTLEKLEETFQHDSKFFCSLAEHSEKWGLDTTEAQIKTCLANFSAFVKAGVATQEYIEKYRNLHNHLTVWCLSNKRNRYYFNY